jgi:hypothetical protein
MSGLSLRPPDRNVTIAGGDVRAGAMQRMPHVVYAENIRACQRRWSSTNVAIKK